MRRLNVQQDQFDACIEYAMFALHVRPQNPPLQPGEPLLLQLVKRDAVRLRKFRSRVSRVNFALIFDRLAPDPDGHISRQYWPTEGRTWRWIVYGSGTVPTIPFSLEDLPLAETYGGQDNCRYITPADERVILPYIQADTVASSRVDASPPSPAEAVERFGRDQLLAAIHNHDYIARRQPRASRTVTTTQPSRNERLAESLKAFYGHRCQICDADFSDRYGVPLAETHHIHYLSEGGADESANMLVLCPNHHSLIHATGARFDRATLTFEYRNGLKEQLLLTDHLTA